MKETCRRCNGEYKEVNLSPDLTKRKLRHGQKYCFTKYLKCTRCNAHKNLESHKILIPEDFWKNGGH